MNMKLEREMDVRISIKLLVFFLLRLISYVN